MDIYCIANLVLVNVCHWPVIDWSSEKVTPESLAKGKKLRRSFLAK